MGKKGEKGEERIGEVANYRISRSGIGDDDEEFYDLE